MKTAIPHIALFLILVHFPAIAKDESDNHLIIKGKLLTLDQCIETALRSHPELMEYLHRTEINETLVGQAEADLYPVIDWAAGYRRDQAVQTFNRDDLGLPTSSILHGNDFWTDFVVRMKLYDFGKRRTNITIKQLVVKSARYEYDAMAMSIVFRVKNAYYEVVKTKRTKEAILESIEMFQQHLLLAGTFYQAGTKPKYDVTKAEVDLSNEKLKLIEAENELRLAWVTLNNTMGLHSDSEYIIENKLSCPKFDISLEEAMERAYRDRPDLLALIAQEELAEQTIEHTKKEHYPTLWGRGGYNFDGRQFPLDHGWNLGLTITFNIYDGHLKKKKTEEALANLNMVRARIAVLKLDIRHDMQKEYLRLRKAEESIENATIQIKMAKENLELADLRYRSGVGSPIETTDAMVALTNANLVHINALFDYIIAEADIQEAMGNRHKIRSKR